MSYNTTLNTERLLRADSSSFTQLALEVFRFQHDQNPVYRSFCDALQVDVQAVSTIADIPFLPISFFRTHRVMTGNRPAVLEFASSGTTAETTSKHLIADAAIYEKSLLQGFESVYGTTRQYAILALLPSYLERQNASLVYMAKTLMAQSNHPDNGFYIDEWQQLHDKIVKLEQRKQKVLLLGVTFALLDFADAYPMQLQHTTVMETGGMKGRKEELTRAEVHVILKKQWQVPQVHSEYGMTELLSQAYATTDGQFRCTNTMRTLVRDINDPLDVSETGTGALNIIDLANIWSCSFIATDDIGVIDQNGTFEVLGRLDHSALRGCSLMAV